MEFVPVSLRFFVVAGYVEPACDPVGYLALSGCNIREELLIW